MRDLEYYIDAAAKDEPPRPGIILAIRMALLALERLEISDPARHKKLLVVVVETDRCLPDAVQLVTGCRLANRSLKLRDLGKMAAVFVDLRTQRALRLAVRESANQRAAELFPDLGREEGLSRAYRSLSDEELFQEQWVRVRLGPQDLPGYRAPRVICMQCGEGIAFCRHVQVGDRTLCRTCAGEHYYEPL